MEIDGLVGEGGPRMDSLEMDIGSYGGRARLELYDSR